MDDTTTTDDNGKELGELRAELPDWGTCVLRAVMRDKGTLDHHALEDDAGTLWSGPGGPDEEIGRRLVAGAQPQPLTKGQL